MCANSLVNTAAKIYSPWIEDFGECKRKRDENRSSLSTMTTRAAIVLYYERFSGRDVFDNNGVSLENSDRI